VAVTKQASTGAGGALPSPSTLSPSPSRSKPAAQKMLDRLESIYESGKVMPVAFLRAENAAPLALLNADAVRDAAGYAGKGVDGDPLPLAGASATKVTLGQGGLNGAALKLISDLAMEGMLAGVPQHMRENYMKQVIPLHGCPTLAVTCSTLSCWKTCWYWKTV
jgi:hypothetical protein